MKNNKIKIDRRTAEDTDAVGREDTGSFNLLVETELVSCKFRVLGPE